MPILPTRARSPTTSRSFLDPLERTLPVLPWAHLGGYPAGELLTALVWMVAVLRRDELVPAGTPSSGEGWQVVAFLPFLWILVALSFIDLEHKILPNKIVYPSVVTAIPLLASRPRSGLGSMLGCALYWAAWSEERGSSSLRSSRRPEWGWGT